MQFCTLLPGGQLWISRGSPRTIWRHLPSLISGSLRSSKSQPEAGTRPRNASGTRLQAAALPPPAFHLFLYHASVSSIESLCKQITPWRSSSGMQFLIRSLMLYGAELRGAGYFSVSALPGTLWWHLSDVALPYPHRPPSYSWQGGRREQTAQLRNSTASEWRGAANSPQFVTRSWFRMGLKHATPHKCQLHRKPCKQLAYTDTQFLELIFKFNFIFLIYLLPLLCSLSQAPLNHRRTAFP